MQAHLTTIRLFTCQNVDDRLPCKDESHISASKNGAFSFSRAPFVRSNLQWQKNIHVLEQAVLERAVWGTNPGFDTKHKHNPEQFTRCVLELHTPLELQRRREPARRARLRRARPRRWPQYAAAACTRCCRRRPGWPRPPHPAETEAPEHAQKDSLDGCIDKDSLDECSGCWRQLHYWLLRLLLKTLFMVGLLTMLVTTLLMVADNAGKDSPNPRIAFPGQSATALGQHCCGTLSTRP